MFWGVMLSSYKLNTLSKSFYSKLQHLKYSMFKKNLTVVVTKNVLFKVILQLKKGSKSH